MPVDIKDQIIIIMKVLVSYAGLILGETLSKFSGLQKTTFYNRTYGTFSPRPVSQKYKWWLVKMLSIYMYVTYVLLTQAGLNFGGLLDFFRRGGQKVSFQLDFLTCSLTIPEFK